MSDVEHIVTKIRKDALYKAPELLVGWLGAYLAAYGAPLLAALRELPAAEREDMRLEAAALRVAMSKAWASAVYRLPGEPDSPLLRSAYARQDEANAAMGKAADELRALGVEP